MNRYWWYITGAPQGPIGPFHAETSVAFSIWNPLNQAGKGTVQLWYLVGGQWIQA